MIDEFSNDITTVTDVKGSKITLALDLPDDNYELNLKIKGKKIMLKSIRHLKEATVRNLVFFNQKKLYMKNITSEKVVIKSYV